MGRQLAFPSRAERIWDWIDNIYKEETKKKKKKEGNRIYYKIYKKKKGKNRKVM